MAIALKSTAIDRLVPFSVRFVRRTWTLKIEERRGWPLLGAAGTIGGEREKKRRCCWITNLTGRRCSKIGKEYSSTPMGPIRIQRQLGQSSIWLSLRLSRSLGGSMVEEAGDGRPVKPHSVGQPAPWNPSSPSLVDGSLYIQALSPPYEPLRYVLRRPPILFRLDSGRAQPCRRVMLRYPLSTEREQKLLDARWTPRNQNFASALFNVLAGIFEQPWVVALSSSTASSSSSFFPSFPFSSLPGLMEVILLSRGILFVDASLQSFP